MTAYEMRIIDWSSDVCSSVLALDHPETVLRVAVLDIAPTAMMYATTDRSFATAYYHWFFLIQPAPLPETLIGAYPDYYLRATLEAWSKSGMSVFSPAAIKEYSRAFRDPACLSASCEDYRASASIDRKSTRLNYSH